MFRLIILATLTLSIGVAHAQESVVGTSPLALFHPKFDCGSIVDAYGEGRSPVALAALYHTFGKNTKCFARINSAFKDRSRIIQLHLFNGPGRRNSRLEPHELSSGDRPSAFCRRFRRQSPRFLNALGKYLLDARLLVFNSPDIKWYVSPELESNCYGVAARRMLELTRSFFPTANIVWNPSNDAPGARRPIEGYLHELHGFEVPKPPCVWNYDGLDIALPGREPIEPNVPLSWTKDLLDIQRRCELRFIWTREMNCIEPGGFVPPTRRTECSIPNGFRKFLR